MQVYQLAALVHRGFLLSAMSAFLWWRMSSLLSAGQATG
jgi:hypothetical protein